MTTISLLPIFLCTFGADDRNDLNRCGANCLEVALHALEHPEAGSGAVDELLGPATEKGYSLGELQSAAEKLDLRTRLVRTSLDNLLLREPGFVCVVPLEGGHFVLLGDYNGRDVWIVDPPGEYSLAVELFQDRWDGIALLMSNSELVPEDGLGDRWKGWLLILSIVLAVACLVAWRLRSGR